MSAVNILQCCRIYRDLQICVFAPHELEIYKFITNSISHIDSFSMSPKVRGKGRVATLPAPQPTSDEAESVKASVVLI